jgi:hypothetical protein
LSGGGWAERGLRLLEKALKPIVEVLGARVEDVADLEIDAYGPRVIVQVKPQDPLVESVFIDASPDGVEAVYTLRLQRGMNRGEVEDRVAAGIEESDSMQAVQEYDVAYEPESGELTITLHVKLLPELPSLKDVRRIIEESLGI